MTQSIDVFAQENRLYHNSNSGRLQHFKWKANFAYFSLNYKLFGFFDTGIFITPALQMLSVT
jgi:hypothetical protein